MLIHESLSSGRWQTLSLMEQLGNIGSEVGRTAKWWTKDRKIAEGASDRALELIDLTLADPRWRGRRKEIARARELFCDAMYGSKQFNTTLADMDAYFFHFAVAANSKRLH